MLRAESCWENNLGPSASPCLHREAPPCATGQGKETRPRGAMGRRGVYPKAPLPTRSAAVGAAVLLSGHLSIACRGWDPWPKLYGEEVAASPAGAPHRRQGCACAGDGVKSSSVPPPPNLRASPPKHHTGLVQKRRGNSRAGSGCTGGRVAGGSGSRWPTPASRWPPASLPAPN